ncbi:MAG: hypothetical protein RMM31_06580 [Anaerolineae bacterium]|nr:hypothetical protein [Thermoflexales bacterium]MDW8395889.1 hypothetical protein [Anaerolineae bacterium]
MPAHTPNVPVSTPKPAEVGRKNWFVPLGCTLSVVLGVVQTVCVHVPTAARTARGAGTKTLPKTAVKTSTKAVANCAQCIVWLVCFAPKAL